MIIAIDGYEANVENRVGIGRYAYELLKNMHEVISRQSSVVSKTHTLQFRIYLPQLPRGDMPKETSWWQYRVVSPQKLWTFLALPFYLQVDMPRADVVFSPTHYVPRFISMPRVFSIMDVSYIDYPELFRPKDLHQLVHGTAYSARLAREILTISAYSKSAILRTYRVPKDRVHVVYPGLTQLHSTALSTSTYMSNTYKISKYYILSVGTLQPRKNFVRLVEAFAQFLKKNHQQYSNLELVVVGKKGWLYDEILAAPKKYGIEDRVKFLDFVPDRDLPSLYKNALCFALPSLYEGFGLPVLEAMSYGTPVVVSKTSSLPEIAGDAGVYVDPQSVESIAQGLLTAVGERNLLQGKKRVLQGLERVKQFTWEKAAKQTLKILENVTKQSNTT